MNGAGILIEELVHQGVTTVFGYPGGQVLPIYDELYKNSDRINHIISAHEQGAVHAADGYARVTGEAGVVIATSGPGATNLVTGIANAYLDSVPLVVITGNVATGLLGRDSFQEVDIIGVTLPIVKHSYIVKNIDKLQPVIREAFEIARKSRRGPVLIDIPRDIQSAEGSYVELAAQQEKAAEKNQTEDREQDLVKAVELINASKQPYIYAGGGVVAAGAGETLEAFSEKLNAPIGFSMMGITAVPHTYRFNLGMTGMHGRYAASKAKSEADLIIAVGVRFSDRATGNKEKYTEKCKIIHIDIDRAEFNKNIKANVEVHGDAAEIIAALHERINPKNNPEWTALIERYQAEEKSFNIISDKMTPNNVIETVNGYTSPDTIIATDVGQHQMWVMQYYRFMKTRTLLSSCGLGAMGFGLGAAVGGSIGAGRKKTVLWTGDGSFGMNLIELTTAVSQQLPVVVIVMNNGVLGMVRQWQTKFYGARYSQTTLNRATDFVKIAEGFGARGYRVETLAELKTILNDHFNSPTPVVIDCVIDKDERVLPMIPPGGSIDDIIVN
jgi:acetolactate synthase-1/2/3 large subunit